MVPTDSTHHQVHVSLDLDFVDDTLEKCFVSILIFSYNLAAVFPCCHVVSTIINGFIFSYPVWIDVHFVLGLLDCSQGWTPIDISGIYGLTHRVLSCTWVRFLRMGYGKYNHAF